MFTAAYFIAKSLRIGRAGDHSARQMRPGCRGRVNRVTESLFYFVEGAPNLPPLNSVFVDRLPPLTSGPEVNIQDRDLGEYVASDVRHMPHVSGLRSTARMFVISAAETHSKATTPQSG